MNKRPFSTYSSLLSALIGLTALNSASAQVQMTGVKSTQFDGVSSDLFVSYASFAHNTSLTTSLANTDGKPMDYTIAFWFKILDDPTDTTLFDISDAVSCAFLSDDRIICESKTKCSKLHVDASQIQMGAWTHLTLTGYHGNSSALVLQDNNNLHDFKVKPYIPIKQTVRPWAVSFGNIPEVSAAPFIGGIREFIFTSIATPLLQLPIAKNQYHKWNTFILGYYRFDYNSFYEDEFRNSQLSEVMVDGIDHETNDTIKVPYFSLPSIEFDFIANDVCRHFLKQEQYLAIDQDSMFQTISLDKDQFDFTRKFYDYTFSIWLKIDAETGTIKQGRRAFKGENIFKFEEVFTLYMVDQNKARFYFHALKNYFEVPSQEIFIPTYQWVNIQLAVSQFQGYEIHVYDTYGDLVDKIVDKTQLNEQMPSGKIRMFDNYRGLVKSVVLLDKRVTLPYIPENKWNSTEKSMLINFNFQPSDFSNGKFVGIESTRKSETFVVKDQVSFEYSNYANFYFKPELSRMALMSQSNFDGVACNDSNYNVMLSTKKSYIRQKLMNVKQPTRYMTVEFWFFINEQNQTVSNTTNTTKPFQGGTLFTLSEDSKNSTAMVISVDNNRSLSCNPVGSNGTTILQLGQVYDSVWYKVTCSFQYQVSAEASLYGNSVQLSSDFKNLTSNNDFIPAGNYTFILGNGEDLQSGLAQTGYRELAIWNSSFSLAPQLYQQLYLYDYNAYWLLSYIRLASGVRNTFDLASLLDPANRESQAEVNDLAPFVDDSLLICPQQTLFFEGQCYDSPFYTLNLVSLPFWNETEQVLHWTFSTLNSVSVDDSLLNSVIYEWEFNDSILNSLFNQTSTSSVTIPSYAFRDEASYHITVTATNQERSYNKQETIHFVPVSCRFYRDSQTNTVSTQRTITSPKSSSDVNFEMNLATQNDQCNSMSFYNVPYVADYHVSGDISSMPLMTFDIDISDYSIIAVIPQEEQHKFQSSTFMGPKATIIIKIGWTSSMFEDFVDKTAGTVFQNIVYEIEFQEGDESVVPMLAPNFNELLKGETLILDGSSTYINSTQTDAGTLSFSWTCPNDLVSLCDQINQSGSNIFEIDYADYIQLGPLNVPMIFSLNILWSKPDMTQLTYKMSQNITWTDIEAPIVEMIEPALFLNSKPNIFQLEFPSNYVNESSRDQLRYTWIFNPPVTNPIQTLTFSNSDTNCGILEGGLDEMTQYNITVRIQNIRHPRAFDIVQSSFTTSKVPHRGFVGSNPPVGNNETEMTFFIQDWHSAQPPITYKIWAQTSQGQELMTLNWIDSQNNHTSIPINNFPVVFQITDNSGEQVLIEYSISTGVSNETDIVILKAQLDAAPTSFARLNILKAMSQRQVDSQDKRIIIDEIVKNTDNLSVKSDSDEDIENVKSAPEILANILGQPEELDDAFIEKSLLVLNKIIISRSIFAEMTKVQEFRDNFVSCISQLLSYTEMKSIERKLLETSSRGGIQSANDEIFDLLDEFLLINCETTEEYMSTQAIYVNGILVKYQKVPKSGLTDSHSVQVSSKQISAALNFSEFFKLSQDAESICAGVIFLDQAEFIVSEQLSQAIDSNMKYFAYANDGMGSSQLDLQSKVSFDVEIDSRYMHNQTMCMLYNEDTTQWEDYECLTDSSNIEGGMLSCMCNTINGDFVSVFTDGERIHDTSLTLDVTIVDQTDMTMTKVIQASFLTIVSLSLITLLIISIKLDKRDVIQAEKPNALLSQQFISTYAKRTQDHDNIVQLKSAELAMYLRNSQLTNSKLMSIVIGSYNPATSFVTRFDVVESRIARFTMMVFQFSLVLLLQAVIASSMSEGSLNWAIVVTLIMSGALLLTFLATACRIKWFNNRSIIKREDTQQNSESAKGIVLDEEDKNIPSEHQLQMKYTCVMQLPKIELVLFGLLTLSCHIAALIIAAKESEPQYAQSYALSMVAIYFGTYLTFMIFQCAVLAVQVKMRRGTVGRIIRASHLAHTVKEEVMEQASKEQQATNEIDEEDISASRMTDPVGNKTVAADFGSRKQLVDVETRAMQSCQKQMDIWDPIFIEDSNEKMRKSTSANDKKGQVDIKAVTKPRYSTLNWQATNE